jgi:hypothetical protein
VLDQPALDPQPVVTMVPDSTVPLEIHERAVDAGCYEFITELWFIDDRVASHYVRAIREAVPHYVPLKCRRVYRTPTGTDEFVDYHVIGSYIEHPNEGYEDDYLRLQFVPLGFPFPSDKIQALRTLRAEWPKGSLEANQAKPDPPVEFGPWVVEQMRSVRKFFDGAIRIDGDDVRQGDFQADKMRAIVNAERKRDKEVQEQTMQEVRYRVRHDWRNLKTAIDNERWAPEPPAKKLTLDLKG